MGMMVTSVPTVIGSPMMVSTSTMSRIFSMVTSIRLGMVVLEGLELDSGMRKTSYMQNLRV